MYIFVYGTTIHRVALTQFLGAAMETPSTALRF